MAVISDLCESSLAVKAQYIHSYGGSQKFRLCLNSMCFSLKTSKLQMNTQNNAGNDNEQLFKTEKAGARKL